ncbi:MAG: DUF368 domain-containing protein, partial [Candidatus Nanohaloarchaea archaeon]
MDDDTADGSWIGIFLRGVAMGTADTIPGVSGGTVALITGIYGRLVAAVAAVPSLAADVPDLVRREDSPSSRLRSADIPFLLVLLAGILAAVVTLSGVIHTLMGRYPAPMNALFFGLIAASAAVVRRDVTAASARTAAAASAGFLAAFLVTGVSGGAGIGNTLPAVFVSGAVASAAMLLPGISGAAFLYILGQYAYLTGTLSRFTGSVLSGSVSMSAGAVVLVFVAGVAAGVVSIARLVGHALDRAPDATMAALVGLMVGALRLP